MNNKSRFITIGTLTVALLISGKVLLGQGGQPDLVITSPQSGSSVSPGQSIAIVVVPGKQFAWISVDGTYPLSGDEVEQPPYSFNVFVPSSTPTGSYKIYATAGTSATSGIQAASQAVIINVEKTGSVAVGLRAQPSAIIFQFVGEQIPLDARATFSNGTVSVVTNSAQMSYVSSNVSVAAVDARGLVTATGGGTANVTVTYGGQTVTVPVSVPGFIRGDFNGDGKVNLDDVNILTAALNTLATKPTDARDLNDDGKIDALDARILVTLCSKAKCAY